MILVGADCIPLHALQISADKLTKIAQDNWSTDVQQSEKPPAFNPELIVSIYNDELAGASSDKGPSLKRIMLLEISQYLENYLWPNFEASSASFEHVMSMILMVNEKFREGIQAWTCFNTKKVCVHADCMGVAWSLAHACRAASWPLLAANCEHAPSHAEAGSLCARSCGCSRRTHSQTSSKPSWA